MTYAIHEVTLRVGAATLLADVSLELRPGEVVAVAGPNGAGKSSLLRVLSGELRPTAGSVALDARPLGSWSGARLARRRAVMGTERTVAFAFTATEVALMGRLPHHGGNPTDLDRAVVRERLAAVDCASLADRIYATLSTGERQRVRLARALAQVAGGRCDDTDMSRPADESSPDEGAPCYLLLDEPTSSLDPAHQHVAMALLRREADAGRGVLAILHDLQLAAAYADRIVLMRGGRIVETGEPASTLRSDLLESVFDIPMLVMPHPHRTHPLVIAEPPMDARGRSA